MSRKMKTKILFIGIDSGDKDLIYKWSEEGKLPTFKNIIETSAQSLVESPRGFYVGSVWPSFATGLSPANHGRYCYEQIQIGSYLQKQYDISKLGEHKFFWDILSQKNQKVCVIDVPLTPPSEEINGVQITDWLVHKAQESRSGKFFTCPPDLADIVEAEYGRNPVPRCDDIEHTPENLIFFKEKMLERIYKKADLSLNLLEQGGWDLFLTTFTETHCVGHHCWHLIDPSHPEYNPQLALDLGNPILEVYQALDTAIGKLIASVDEKTYVFVFSSHGMGPDYDLSTLLNTIVERLSELDKPAVPLPIRVSRWIRMGIRFFWRRLGIPIPEFLLTPNIALQKFYAVTNNNSCGAIRINLVGRESQGKVKPGIEFNNLCQQISEDLRAITIDNTGESLVSRVIRTDLIYQGEYLSEMPDLLVEWNRKKPIKSINSPKIGRIEHRPVRLRTGDHLPEGILFAKGPGILSGYFGEHVSVLDFAPTILHFLGNSFDRFEGKIIPFICVDRAEINASSQNL
jgi:predicted AlkP superfamily phosphohydrolase/phosphomutase